MAVLTVAAETVGAWQTPSEKANIVIGVQGSSYQIQFHLGTDTLVFAAGKPASGFTYIAKAAQVRVVNTGKAELSYEMM